MTSSGGDGATPISPEEQADLIPDISTQEELNEWERQNILDAVAWSSRNLHRRDPLDESYVRDLHRRMFDQTWKWAGTYRATEKNIGVAPHRVQEELAKLIADTRYWIDNDTYRVDEIGVRLHHRLVFIHPFPNGNGRHARLIADIILERVGAKCFTWGSGSLVASGVIRDNYLRALRCADGGDIGPLSVFVRS